MAQTSPLRAKKKTGALERTPEARKTKKNTSLNSGLQA